jgi:hypothetical protein
VVDPVKRGDVPEAERHPGLQVSEEGSSLLG